MISYELAKELKDAGFPQNDDRALFETDIVSFPSLEELIEACGDGYFTLCHPIGMWQAHMGLEENTPWFNGATPEEAVVRLWLALNKK